MSFSESKRLSTDLLAIEAWGEVKADENSCMFSLIAPDIAIRPFGTSIHALAREKDDTAYFRMRVDVDLYYCPQENSMLVKACSFIGSEIDGLGLKVSQMHKIPVEKIISAFPPDLYVVDMANSSCVLLSDWETLMDNVPFQEYRVEGPTENTLIWVARVYRVAQLLRKSPTKSVAERFGIPTRTASHWVKLMKERIWTEGTPNKNSADLVNFLWSDLGEETAASCFYHVTGVGGE